LDILFRGDNLVLVRNAKKASESYFFHFLLFLVALHTFVSIAVQAQASQKSIPESSHQALVTEIRQWSGSARTRIVIDLDQAVVYKDHILKEDKVHKKPPRLYIDITGAELSPHLKEPISIEAGILKRVRAGQYTPDTVRVVLDLESVADYKVFPLSDPFRIVIDVLGTVRMTPQETASTVPPKQRSRPFKIVIDAGHGGEDPGAVGPTGLKEKDVVLKLAHKIRDKVKKMLDWEVVMTREDDRFIRLEDRTAIATTEGGNLFVSIHANASTDRRVCGIQSFFLGTTTDKDALRLAAKENNISTQQVSDLQVILADLKLNDPAKVVPSSLLAGNVQSALVKSLHKKYEKIRDLGVKQAPFVVLIGAEMPSILIEVSFISNPSEERRLRDPRYLDSLADAIVAGLQKYAQDNMVLNDQPSVSVSKAFNSN
jgi:N-acetylmuramoyl-L-alanine amidase